jgi:ribulose-phosphate 3-epimerase
MSRFWASVASADLGRLAELALSLQDAGVDGVHVDIADGVFVPDLTFGHRVVKALTDVLSIPVEAHLMVCTPEEQLRAAADAGASRVAFHLESTRYPARIASLARALGVSAGMALNPVSELAGLGYLAPGLDFVNLLATEPDLAEERMLPLMAERVQLARATFGAQFEIQVDGDVSASNVGVLADSGAQHFVVGRALVAEPDPSAALRALRAAAHGVIPEAVRPNFD